MKDVPGFRSGTRWKQGVAVLGYLIFAALLIFGTPGLKVMSLIVFGGTLLAVNAWGIRLRVPVFRSANRFKAAGGWAVIGVLFLAASTIGVTPVARSPKVAVETEATAPTGVPVAVLAASVPTEAPVVAIAPTLIPATEIPATAIPVPTIAPPPTVDPAVALASQQWGEFLIYGPELITFLTRSDALNTTHQALAARGVTPANRGAFYTATNQAAQRTGQLKTQSTQVKAPASARDFQNAVTLALSRREDAFNKLKDVLDRQSASTESAYQTAKQLADISGLAPLLRMQALCGTMTATIEECNAAVGL